MILERLRELVAEQFAVDADSIERETSFFDDLGADSLDIVELTMALEEEFDLAELPEEDLRKLTTVGDVADYVASKTDD